MRIAIIGAGISGLAAAYRLQAGHEVTLFEANAYVGGHTHTVDVELAGRTYCIDTGFIVFNDRTYPHFCQLLDEWGVASQPTTMSFSVRCARSGFEYRGVDLNGLFAQRRNLLRPQIYRIIADFFRFSRLAREVVAGGDDRQTVGDFLASHRFSRDFRELYFLPMASAVWSCPGGKIEQFPIRFVAEFYHHHGMLSAYVRPQWRVVRGGSQAYVAALLRRFRGQVVTSAPVATIERDDSAVRLAVPGNGWLSFDHVVFACHADQALRILGNQATPAEREILSAFPYEQNSVVLHTDRRLLPRSRRAWACWNYFIPWESTGRATVTYSMNLLQGIAAAEQFLVTLNGDDRIDPERVLQRMTYHHPVFDARRAAAQRRHAELIAHNRTSFCGAYWKNGFHEDGVVSALAVCQALQYSNQHHAQLPLRGLGSAPAALAG